jgi:hypothetical protein
MLHVLLLLSAVDGAVTAPLATAEIVDRMLRADQDRHSALAGYSGVRHYHFENKRVNKRADMTVRMTCDSAGIKTFEVVDESGSGFVRNRILRKMLEAEHEASEKEERNRARLIPANYDFQLVGNELLDGRNTYVLELVPKTASKFLIRGRIWVDADEFAVVRVEGQPAKNPSFWIRSVHIVQQYARTGQFWLPVTNESSAEARIFGRTDVSIEYFDYATTLREAQARSSAAQEGRP